MPPVDSNNTNYSEVVTEDAEVTTNIPISSDLVDVFSDKTRDTSLFTEQEEIFQEQLDEVLIITDVVSSNGGITQTIESISVDELKDGFTYEFADLCYLSPEFCLVVEDKLQTRVLGSKYS